MKLWFRLGAGRSRTRGGSAPERPVAGRTRFGGSSRIRARAYAHGPAVLKSASASDALEPYEPRVLRLEGRHDATADDEPAVRRGNLGRERADLPNDWYWAVPFSHPTQYLYLMFKVHLILPIVIGLILSAVAILLVYESRGLLVGEAVDRETLASVREIAEAVLLAGELEERADQQRR